jgi:hypothetical protein
VKRTLAILLLTLTALYATAQTPDTIRVPDQQPSETYEAERHRTRDTAVYQGTYVKLDLFNPAFEALRAKGRVQDYEVMVSVRLKQRFYPAIELGYAQAKDSANGGHYSGKGGFIRLGTDINGLKKHPESPHALLVGVRIGTAVQGYDLTGIYRHDDYWQTARGTYTGITRADVWGEVIGGCNVQIAGGFHMGWYIRLKVLFTRTDSDNGPLPYYIPGFGYRDDMNWGFNYYIAWRF